MTGRVEMRTSLLKKLAPLTLAVAMTLTSIAQGPLKDQPMAADAKPGFLVVTVKPTDPNRTGTGFPTEGHRITCYGATVVDILLVAYGIHAKQIVDAPQWFTKDRYDVDGIPDVPGVPNLPQMQEMYRKLLADRFHMTIHREVRQIPIYAVTVAKGGPNLKLADPSEQLNTGNQGSGGQRILKFTNMPMDTFVLNMNFYEDRPVINQTGLPGNYDFSLKWTYDDSQPHDADAAPSLFTALKEQLGLKIDAVKGPAPVIIIDHAEKPSEN